MRRWQNCMCKIFTKTRITDWPNSRTRDSGATKRNATPAYYEPLLKKVLRGICRGIPFSQIKLRCDKKYVFFQFDPALEYKVADKYGKCFIEVVGDPETKFELI